MWPTVALCLAFHIVLTTSQEDPTPGGTFRWDIVRGSCSESCGPTGIVHFLVICFNDVNGRTLTVAEEMCHLIPKPPNPGIHECNRVPCPAKWKVNQWGECSATCGGVEIREVICEQFQGDGRGIIDVEDSQCPRRKPAVDRKCGDDCPQLPTESPTERATERPTERATEHVTERPTESASFKWVLTNRWGECSNTCGKGKRPRQVECAVESSDGLQEVVLNDVCERAGLASKPLVEELCLATGRTRTWVTSNWFKCSRRCGGGITRRQVRCINGCTGRLHGAGKCSIRSRPAHRQICNDFPCNRKGCQDQSKCLCRVVEKFGLCNNPGYDKICCRSCHRLLANYARG